MQHSGISKMQDLLSHHSRLSELISTEVSGTGHSAMTQQQNVLLLEAERDNVTEQIEGDIRKFINEVTNGNERNMI